MFHTYGYIKIFQLQNWQRYLKFRICCCQNQFSCKCFRFRLDLVTRRASVWRQSCMSHTELWASFTTSLLIFMYLQVFSSSFKETKKHCYGEFCQISSKESVSLIVLWFLCVSGTFQGFLYNGSHFISP